jgi:hypothetical protein
MTPEGGMATPQPDPKRVSEVQSGKNPEAALGGADSVDKTTYTSPTGDTLPERRGSTRGTTEPTKTGGMGTLGWVVVALAALALLVYAAGAFR